MLDGACEEYYDLVPVTAVKERHFSLPAAPVKQPVTQLGYGFNHPGGKGIPLSSQLKFLNLIFISKQWRI